MSQLTLLGGCNRVVNRDPDVIPYLARTREHLAQENPPATRLLPPRLIAPSRRPSIRRGRTGPCDYKVHLIHLPCKILVSLCCFYYNCLCCCCFCLRGWVSCIFVSTRSSWLSIHRALTERLTTSSTSKRTSAILPRREGTCV